MMEKKTRDLFDRLSSTDDPVRMEALQSLLNLTDEKVDWIYEVWDDLVTKLGDENSYHRSIAIKLLCNLVKSDAENRLEDSLENLLAHTRDEKFITSRQCLQSIWKLAAANDRTRGIVLNHLEKRFHECMREKHYNLLRQDILHSLLRVYNMEKDGRILKLAKELTAQEPVDKYRKVYETILEEMHGES